MAQIIECVPNFSEGNDLNIIKQITDEIERIEGVKLLNVDPGKATNRTVVTLVGAPDAVINAAFSAIKKASELIDMGKHKGEHPRMGATDVCPLIPIANISMEETAEYAKKLATRVGNELNIPVYLYESAQPNEARKNLSIIREGEYEGFFKKIKLPEWKPDFGPAEFNAKSGGTVIGARDFLIAYNVNLNTKSVKRANSVAFDIREAGRVKKDAAGKTMKDEKGSEIRIPGKLNGVKAIGWYIEEYSQAQVSINITNMRQSPLHLVFEECCNSAQARGLRVTGSELVGLVPKSALIDAGKYFLKKQKLSAGVSEKELVEIAVKSMGLSELSVFEPQKKVIEYLMEGDKKDSLVKMNLTGFADETASESPAPGGGSIAAYAGALGAALGAMVANLSAGKRGWEEHWEEFSNWAEKGQYYKDILLKLVDEDTQAFNTIMTAFSLPKGTDEEKRLRKEAIEKATQNAAEVPLKTMQAALDSMEVIKAMAEHGNPNSVSDAGVGALCAKTAVMGANLNVRINASSLEDKQFAQNIISRAKEIEDKAIKLEKEVLEIVNGKIA